MTGDFIRGLAARLHGLFDGKYPVYWGRLPQGERRPGFFIPPVQVERREQPCGRIWRQLRLELHFYTKAVGLSELALQEQVGERLLRELGNIEGAGGRQYRGRELKYQPGEEFLRLWGRYEFYTTLEQERLAAGEELAAGEIMQELELKK